MSATTGRVIAMDSVFIGHFTEKEIGRFWIHSGKKESSDCWNWTAAKLPAGYGLMSINRGSRILKKQIKAHRISWMIHFGMIPENLCVCHKCDNPSCVNPSHLFLGTIQENNADKYRKGRQKNPFGEQHGCCKFSDEKIEMIKQDAFLGYLTQYQIAEKHGCSQQHVSQIKIGTRRSHR